MRAIDVGAEAPPLPAGISPGRFNRIPAPFVNDRESLFGKAGSIALLR